MLGAHSILCARLLCEVAALLASPHSGGCLAFIFQSRRVLPSHLSITARRESADAHRPLFARNLIRPSPLRSILILHHPVTIVTASSLIMSNLNVAAITERFGGYYNQVTSTKAGSAALAVFALYVIRKRRRLRRHQSRPCCTPRNASARARAALPEPQGRPVLHCASLLDPHTAFGYHLQARGAVKDDQARARGRAHGGAAPRRTGRKPVHSRLDRSSRLAQGSSSLAPAPHPHRRHARPPEVQARGSPQSPHALDPARTSSLDTYLSMLNGTEMQFPARRLIHCLDGLMSNRHLSAQLCVFHQVGRGADCVPHSLIRASTSSRNSARPHSASNAPHPVRKGIRSRAIASQTWPSTAGNRADRHGWSRSRASWAEKNRNVEGDEWCAASSWLTPSRQDNGIDCIARSKDAAPVGMPEKDKKPGSRRADSRVASTKRSGTMKETRRYFRPVRGPRRLVNDPDIGRIKCCICKCLRLLPFDLVFSLQDHQILLGEGGRTFKGSRQAEFVSLQGDGQPVVACLSTSRVLPSGARGVWRIVVSSGCGRVGIVN
ncbi:hypothetical protein L1887_46823 [Cichorium endivia]|nr:hypothetical protein L1887_46823 [Cichorium endivia]